jgi:hypothetical protein
MSFFCVTAASGKIELAEAKAAPLATPLKMQGYSSAAIKLQNSTCGVPRVSV